MNPKKNSKEVLLKILTIIDYQDNSETFIKEFLKLCIQKTLLDILAVASDENKQNVIKLSEANLSSDELERKLKNTIGENLFDSSLEKATKETFSQYLETIYPTLSASQDKSLQLFLNSL